MFRELLIFVIFSTVSSNPLMEITDPKVKNLTETLHKVCVSKIGVQEASIEQGKKGIFDRDPKLMEYWTCVWTTSGLMDQKGNIDFELLHSLAPSKVADATTKLVGACHNKVAGEKVLTSLVLKMTQCIATTNSELFIIF
uniref:Odorant binding protein 20 n=1 Tax=Galeruca daurica TaxID=1651263 RepID=A0A1U9W504_9CUCU|nr:odorant-binding protein [Galeruca daurica]QDD67568.1 odorant binding protein 20 [Galeruca daurica]